MCVCVCEREREREREREGGGGGAVIFLAGREEREQNEGRRTRVSRTNWYKGCAIMVSIEQIT